MKIIVRQFVFPILILIFFAGCQKTRTSYFSFDGFALGTTYHISVQLPDTAGMQYSIDSLFKKVNNSMSVYNPHSLLNRINRNETDSVDKYIEYCIETAARISDLSNGEYDITVKPLTQAWGFTGDDPQYKPNVDSLLQYVGYKKIEVHNGRLIKENPNIQIELNSIAKGYAVDLLGDVMASRGAVNYLVEIGGEIFCSGVNVKGTEWNVGIDKPSDGNIIPGMDLQTVITFTNKGLATSGNYRKFYVDPDGQKVVHTINARTGESRPSNLLSATVIAENSAVADALGTLMMVIGLERSIELLENKPEWMGYLIYADQDGEFQTYITPNLMGNIRE